MNIDSVLHQYKQTYFNLPRPIKHFLGELYGNIPLSVRFGADFSKHKQLLEKFQNSSEQFQLDYMFNKTAETLFFASEHIPYYRKLFNDYSFKPEEFKDFEDLKKIPYLTKDIIIENIDSLHTDKFDKPVGIQTGGSTRLPMKFFVPLKESRAKEKVYFLNTFEKLDYKYRDKTVGFRDKYYADNENNIFWNYDKVDNYLMISSGHLNASYIELIISEINKFKPKYIYSYPSGLYLFIKSCREIGIDKLDGILGIILTSETVPKSYINYFKAFFGCDIVSHYGHSERICSAYSVNHEYYNFFNSYGLSEVIDNEIIGTSFDNLVMPFINYKTNDFVSGKIDMYSQSNIVKSVEYIDGRLQEYVVTKDNTLICITQLSTEKLIYLKNIDAIQFRQDKPGCLTLLIQSKKSKMINIEDTIKEAEAAAFNLFKFNIEFVEKIKKTANGKWIYCIQNLDISSYRELI